MSYLFHKGHYIWRQHCCAWLFLELRHKNTNSEMRLVQSSKLSHRVCHGLKYHHWNFQTSLQYKQ